MRAFDLYGRRGCHLCEEMIEALLPLLRGNADLRIHDIDSRTDWQQRYNTEIPLLEFDGETICRYHLDIEAVQSRLEVPRT